MREPTGDHPPAPPPDLRTDPQARRATRLPVGVRVAFADSPGVLATLEGPVSYLRGDALVTSDAGEQWPVAREVFECSYEAEAPAPSGASQAERSGQPSAAVPGHCYRKRRMPVLARRMDRDFEVRVGPCEDLIKGRPGDWLLQYEPGRHGIVAADRFAQTYRLDDER